MTLPLVADGYFLDGAGNGDVTFALPSGHPELAGVSAWHAAVVVDLATPAPTLATNAVAMQIE